MQFKKGGPGDPGGIQARWWIVCCGLAGLLGATLFAGAVAFLQVVRGDVDWLRDYVSYFGNGRLGWVFVGAALVHGIGNLATSVGLWLSLHRSAIRTWASFFLALGAMGIIAAALARADPPSQPQTLAGLVHRSIATVAIPLQVVGVFLFSAAFGRERRWRALQRTSFVLATIAAIALVGFFIALLLGAATGLAERLSFASLLSWEIWVSSHLVGSSWPTRSPDTTAARTQTTGRKTCPGR